ncbi:MAG: alpha/beta hydrolase [Spirochaetes bacterium]|nr:alpha/beta hydrolase [Spirochaetota bacterium]
MKKISRFLAMGGFLLLLTQSALSAANFVLVHGAWADAHAFDAVKPMLEAKGHAVVAVNLPGHGSENTPVAEISLQSYVDTVVSVVKKQNEPVILVGHSMGGMVVSQVAENYPEKIRMVIYVAAYLPQNDQDLLSLANQDKQSLVGKNLEFSADKSSATIAQKVLVKAICADCSKELKDILVKYHKAEPTRPLGEKVTLTAARFGKVTKKYIHTSADAAVGYTLQKNMVKANGSITETQTLKTSHLPFLAKPQALVEILEKFSAP